MPRQMPPAPDSFNCDTLTDLSAIGAISSEWDALLDRSPCNRAFSSSTWFLALCNAAPALSPHVITARRDTSLVAVLPLVLTENRREAAFPIYLTDYDDMIARSDDLPALVGLLEYAASDARGYDNLALDRIRADSNCVRAAQALGSTFDIKLAFEGKGRCPYIRLSSSYEEYVSSRGRRFRKGLRSALRKARENNLIARRLDPFSFSPKRIAEDFLSLHHSRFGAKSCFQSIKAQSFIREVLPNLFTERRMEVFALFEGERMIGIDLCMVGADSLCVWNGGFLSEYERWSPGKLLMAAEIEHAYKAGLQEYDLLRGTEEYKTSWATDIRDIGSLEIAIRNSRSQAGRGAA